MLTSVVKRGRDLLAPSPISEGGEEATASSMAGPRRLSYSSTAPHFPRCCRIIMTSIQALLLLDSMHVGVLGSNQ